MSKAHGLLRHAALSAIAAFAMGVGVFTAPPVAAANPSSITPGARIDVEHSDTVSKCTVGPYVTYRQNGEKRYAALSAGHCGSHGEPVFWTDGNGTRRLVGNLFNPYDDIMGSVARDYVLIPLDVGLVNPAVSGMYEPVNIMTMNELSSRIVNGTPTTVCAAGTSSGERCGPLVSASGRTGRIEAKFPSEHGDSGGPVWVKTNDGIRIIGLLRGTPSTDSSISVIVPIEMPLIAYDVKLVVAG